VKFNCQPLLINNLITAAENQTMCNYCICTSAFGGGGGFGGATLGGGGFGGAGFGGGAALGGPSMTGSGFAVPMTGSSSLGASGHAASFGSIVQPNVGRGR